MNWPHNYFPSGFSMDKCGTCNRPEIDHTDRATCEVCGNSGNMFLEQNDILMCLDCKKQQPDPSDIMIDTRPSYEQVKERFNKEDARIQVSTDFFNAETVSLQELKGAIDRDNSILEADKHFALAKEVEKRFTHYSDILYSKRQEILEVESKQRAIQTYYNELAKRLRAEEREKIRMRDATYVVKAPAEKIRAPKISSGPKKYDKNAIKAAAAKSGIPEQMIQILCIQKNISVDEAVALAKEQMGM